MNIELRVQPDVLLNKSGELDTIKTSVIGTMEQIKTDTTSLINAWRSEASDVFQSKFKMIYDDIDNMLAIMTEYISDLNEAANIYIAAENSAVNTNESLPVDGVFRV